MKKNTFALLGFAAALAAGTCQLQAATATGNVTDVWAYANGDVVVTGFQFGATGCQLNHGFIVPHNVDGFKTIMATILSARMTGASLEVRVSAPSGCWYPVLTVAAADYVRLLPN